MSIQQLKEIIQSLPNDTPVLLNTDDIHEAQTVMVEYHSDGRLYVIISNAE